MASISSKSLDQPDELITQPGVVQGIVNVGKTFMSRSVHQPGWRWFEHMKPIVKTQSCQHHHQGVVLSGKIHFVTDAGGQRVMGPGDAFDVPPGHDAWVVGDEPCVMLEFQSGRDWARPPESGERVLATLLVTDIVGSTATAARIGDAAWKALLAKHYLGVRRELDAFRGIEIDTSGDGFLAMFDGAARAVRCAAAIRESAEQDGVEIRAGVHSGEVERQGEQLRGVAVHIAARIAALARAGEILLSASTTSILEGSGLAFSDAGEHELKGIPERRRVFRLE